MYSLAIQEQIAHHEWQAEMASRFFFPRDLPTLVVQRGSEISVSSLSSISLASNPVTTGTVSELSLDSPLDKSQRFQDPSGGQTTLGDVGWYLLTLGYLGYF